MCSQIHTKHINALCGQNVELLNVKPGGTVHVVATGLPTANQASFRKFIEIKKQSLLWCPHQYGPRFLAPPVPMEDRQLTDVHDVCELFQLIWPLPPETSTSYNHAACQLYKAPYSLYGEIAAQPRRCTTETTGYHTT